MSHYAAASVLMCVLSTHAGVPHARGGGGRALRGELHPKNIGQKFLLASREPHAPAMAAGVTADLWSITDIVTMIEAFEPAQAKRGPYKPRKAA